MEKRAPKIHSWEDDRISELPEQILHHILCFLYQKEAIQTCVLSKAWRYVGCTRPKIEFDSVGSGISYSALDRILQVYHDRNVPLEQFTLHMSIDSDDAALLLNKWIPIIVENMCAQSFHLSLNSRARVFELPSLSSIFRSHNIRKLFLERCQLQSCAQMRVDLKRLQTLWLIDVYIPEQMLDNILSNCPLLENVYLLYCTGFTTIKLLSNNKPTNLTGFSFYGNDIDDVSIQIRNDIQTLKTIQIMRGLLSVSHNKPFEFAHLTQLCLTSVKLLFDSFSCNLHCLEELKLVRCSGIKEFNLSSRSVKPLYIYNISRPFEATIHAPSIVSFVYEGILPQSISFANSDNVWKSKINLGSYPYVPHNHSRCFNELYGLLQALSQSEISLELDPTEISRFSDQFLKGSTNDIVGVSVPKQLPVAVEHLTINWSMINMLPFVALFLNSLFHMFRPSYICTCEDMLIYSNNEHHEITKFIFKERETTESYIWQHVLEGVSLQVRYRNKSEWQPCTQVIHNLVRKVLPGNFNFVLS